MNTTELKRFAQGARRKLLEQVGSKLSFVLTADSPELREKTQRFMDANDYQPLGIRIVTPKDGYTSPELMDEAKRGNIPEELVIKRQKVYDLLDGRIPSTNPQNEAYKELLIAACNNLNAVFPFLFEKINDYTELLLPDDLTSDFSIVTDMCEGMPPEDCINVEIIGWLYQFYISEKKDAVIRSAEKVKKEDIPAATQLFTPRWIVEYLVQNTLGKLWMQNKPKSRLIEYMPFFLKSLSLSSDDYLKVSSPEEIKFLDPASGSGHILVYAFDLLTKIYEEEGYNIIDIPKLIIEKNLYGFEIDERAAQLSGLALMMKAREYQRRAFKKDLQPNILCFQDLNFEITEIKNTLKSLHINFSEELIHDLLQLHGATNFGSLIILHSNISEISNLIEKLSHITSAVDVFTRNRIDDLLIAGNQLYWLAEKYHCIVTNPPYMGDSNFNEELIEFVKSNYVDSRYDLMTCFMEMALSKLQQKGLLGMINQHSWMFISSYERLRTKLIKNIFIDSILHLGARTFPEIGGEVVQNAAFVFVNLILNGRGSYFRLINFNNSELKRTKTLEAIQNPQCEWFYNANQKDFKEIPSSPVGYWLSQNLLKAFKNGTLLSALGEPRQGMATTNNNRFLRLWHETSFNKIGFNLTYEDAINSEFKWFPYNKGGEYRKWFGNNEFVVNYYKEGEELKTEVKEKYRTRSYAQGFSKERWDKLIDVWVLKNKQFYFLEGITWSYISSTNLGVRKSPMGFIFDVSGSSLFVDNKLESYILGFLGSKLGILFLDTINPTMNIQAGDIGKLPLIFKAEYLPIIENIVDFLIKKSINDWDSREKSWEFQRNELIRIKGQDVEETYDLFQQHWKNEFFKLHQKEEELNSHFIEIYGLKNELSPNVPLEQITILQEEIDFQELTALNKKLVRDPRTSLIQNYNEICLPFISKEIIAQFISYSVGCMFGRYSLDKEGLILANQGETLQDYLHKIGIIKDDCTFLPDYDNIIPILDDEWFEDDIVERFKHFLKVSFGEKYFNKNLTFIEEQIGKDIRKYFIKDFYPDHLKRFKKRPIYWMFSSPKGNFNVLIYIHRYTTDTISKILNKYLKEFIGKLKTRREHLQHIQVNGSPTEKIKAIKETDSINKMLVELQEYERDILYPLATERIAINLDDGVLVNYNKFGKSLKEVGGLNDKKTKDKVSKFNWNDITNIP